MRNPTGIPHKLNIIFPSKIFIFSNFYFFLPYIILHSLSKFKIKKSHKKSMSVALLNVSIDLISGLYMKLKLLMCERSPGILKLHYNVSPPRGTTEMVSGQISMGQISTRHISTRQISTQPNFHSVKNPLRQISTVTYFNWTHFHQTIFHSEKNPLRQLSTIPYFYWD